MISISQISFDLSTPYRCGMHATTSYELTWETFLTTTFFVPAFLTIPSTASLTRDGGPYNHAIAKQFILCDMICNVYILLLSFDQSACTNIQDLCACANIQDLCARANIQDLCACVNIQDLCACTVYKTSVHVQLQYTRHVPYLQNLCARNVIFCVQQYGAGDSYNTVALNMGQVGNRGLTTTKHETGRA